MFKFIKSQLEAMSLGQLLNMLNPDFNIGVTHFETTYDEDGYALPNEKRWVITHNYFLIAEVNCETDEMDKWETFGYPMETLSDIKTGRVFGSNPKDTLIKFFSLYPQFVINQ